MDDLAAARALSAHLGARFSLTFVKDADAAEALRRMGGCPDTVRERTAPEITDRMGAALTLGAWSVVLEPAGGVDTSLEAVSRGTTAVAVHRDRAAAHFGYAVDGVTVCGFDPGYPAEETVWGSDPGLLRPLMDALGLRAPADESDTGWQDAEARAIVLAQRITGVRLPAQPLSAARLSAQLEPWFVTPPARGDLLRADRRLPWAAGLVAAAEAAPAGVQREVAVAQVRRQAAGLGVTAAPGLAEALEAAVSGRSGPVAADSPLGLRVRGWLAESRKPGDRGLGLENGPDPAASTPAAPAPDRAAALGSFVVALRGVLGSDPRVAVLAALRPLARADDEPARAEALRALASGSI